MTRVLLDCRMASWSGVGRYTTGLARALARRDDIELVQACASDESPPVLPDARTGTVPTWRHPFSIRGALEFGRVAGMVKPDLVHCAHFPTPIPVSGPLVVTMHDLAPLLLPDLMPSVARRFAYRRWNARAARLADRIVVPSRATAACVEELFQDARGKIVITPEAADDFWAGPVGPLPEELGRPTSVPYILSMGNTRAHKDLPTLLRAFGLLTSQGLDQIRLLLVGVESPGYLDTALKDMPSPVRRRVAFTGEVADPELRALYQEASVFVFPSRHEGFGLPPLEAMAFGTPVVCSDATSLPEVVGDAALLFPAGDSEALTRALTRLLDDQATRERLSKAGRERVREFTWEQTAAATVAAYEQALRYFDVRRRGESHPR